MLMIFRKSANAKISHMKKSKFKGKSDTSPKKTPIKKLTFNNIWIYNIEI